MLHLFASELQFNYLFKMCFLLLCENYYVVGNENAWTISVSISVPEADTDLWVALALCSQSGVTASPFTRHSSYHTDRIVQKGDFQHPIHKETTKIKQNELVQNVYQYSGLKTENKCVCKRRIMFLLDQLIKLVENGRTFSHLSTLLEFSVSPAILEKL